MKATTAAFTTISPCSVAVCRWAEDRKFASSEESVGGFWLRELAEQVKQRKFGDPERPIAVRFSQCDFGFVVQALDDAAGELLLGPEVVDTPTVGPWVPQRPVEGRSQPKRASCLAKVSGLSRAIGRHTSALGSCGAAYRRGRGHRAA